MKGATLSMVGKVSFLVGIATALCMSAAALGDIAPSSLGLMPVENMPAARHDALRLVENGRLNFAIVGPFKAERDFRGPEGQPLTKFNRNSLKRAADTLVWAFDGCFGVKPEVLEEDDPKAASYKYVIALGKTRLAAELGIVPDRLPREGFEIKTCEKGVAIAGMDGFTIPGFYDVFNWRSGRITCNGTEWGAADFVERYLGCRKFSLLYGADYLLTPSQSDLLLQSAHYMDHPRQHFRTGYSSEGWRVATSTDFFGGEAPSPFSLARAHPDKIEDIFYRDATGRLWQNSEIYGKNFLDITRPRLAEILVDDFRKYYAQNGRNTYWSDMFCPSTRYMWFGQCDRRVKFSDEVYEKYRRENPRETCDMYSELYGHFYLDFAKRVQQYFPDRRLVLMAYSNYLRAPRTVKRLPDNVQIMACIGTPALAASDVYMNDVYECYDEWNAITSHKVVPYLYPLGGSVAAVMQGLFMGEFLKKTASRTDELGIYYPCFGKFGKEHPLAAYIMYRSAWNPDFDALEGARDFATGLLGVEAGSKVADMVARLKVLWVERYIPEVANGPYVRRGTRSIPQLQHDALYVKMLTDDALAELEGMLDAAEKLVAGDAKRSRIFAKIANPLRKTFSDARAYKRIKIADFDICRSSTKLPDFKKATIDDGTKVVNPDARMSWNDEGLSLSVVSPAPYKLGKDIWDGDSFEFFIAPGDEKPVNLYQFAIAANGQYEDFHAQIDPPRPNDADWKAAGLKVDVKRGEKDWRFDLFLPWSALYDAPPKPGDVWRMNLISNRMSPQEYSAIAPTLGANYRWKFYTRVHFRDNGERLVFNAYLPRGGGFFKDDADRFPSEYLDALAASGVTGVVAPVSFRQIAKTSLTPRTDEGGLCMERLRRAARKCAQHGIRLWIYGNEPARFKPGDPLLKEHPELGGAFFPTHGSTMWCPCRPEVRTYIEEAVRDVFTEVPELGGFLNIAYGEGLTTCLDALECCPIEKYWARPCERCAKRPVWQGYREMSEAIVRGIRSAGSNARYLSWFYQPMATPERAAWVAECAAHAPEGTTFMFNFETGTVLEQMGKMRCSGDYSLAIPGPGRPFADVAEAANRAGVRLGAKIQTASSHELATIPDVPVPGLLYRKYAAMADCGVKDAVLGWSMGGEPGLMLRAADRLSSWDFSRGEDAFLRELAVSEWGEDAEAAVALWKGFSDAFAMYPVDHIVQYLGPFHAGMVWNLFARPESGNVLAGWKGFAEDNGDRIGECLGGFTLAEAEGISGQMADAADAAGEGLVMRLEAAGRGNPERLRQVAMMRAFRIHMQSAHAVFGFYRRRADAIAASRVRSDAATAMRLLSEMRQIVAEETIRVQALIPLARQHDRLGYHPDARCRIYSPESLTRQIARLERTNADLENIGKELAAGRPWPESEREKSAAKAVMGSETVSGGVAWRIDVDGGDLVVSGTCRPECEGLAFVFSDVAGASFPVVCHVPAPGTGDGVFEPRQTAGTCRAECSRLADGGWRFSVRYLKSKWMERGGWRPEWLTIVEDTYPGRRGGARPLWPNDMPQIKRRGDLPWVDGATFGKIVWPLRMSCQ